MRNWENALIARKYDFRTDCNTAYTAHCGTGTFVKSKKCPLKQPVVTRQCLRGLFCWAGARTIEATSQHKVVTLYKGEEEIVYDDDIRVDHVADEEEEVSASSSRASGVVQAKTSEDADRAELESLVQIRDDELPEIMRHEVCSRLRENAWTGFGAIVAARCGLMFRALQGLADITTPLPLGTETVNADVSLTGGVFRTEFIPTWELFSQAANRAILEEMKKEELPMSAEVDSLNITFSAEGELLEFEAWPKLRGTLNEENIELITKGLTGNLPNGFP